jgi:acyl carrier protein
VAQGTGYQRQTSDSEQRFRQPTAVREAGSGTGGENDGLRDARRKRHMTRTTTARRTTLRAKMRKNRGRDVGRNSGVSRHDRVTFRSLAHTTDPARGEAAPGAASSSDAIVNDITQILKRLSRRPIEPRPESELLADLGFDSLQVLELVGELEDHFNIAVPLNDLTHIRTVAQVADEVRRLLAHHEPS